VKARKNPATIAITNVGFWLAVADFLPSPSPATARRVKRPIVPIITEVRVYEVRVTATLKLVTKQRESGQKLYNAVVTHTRKACLLSTYQHINAVVKATVVAEVVNTLCCVLRCSKPQVSQIIMFSFRVGRCCTRTGRTKSLSFHTGSGNTRSRKDLASHLR